jgi:hypothetical protein
MKAPETEERLRAALSWCSHADELLDQVKAGDPKAARNLIFTLDNMYRGLGVRWVLALKLSQECERVAISEAWIHDHRVVRAEAGRRDTLYRWFWNANFNYYWELPVWLTVWHGTSGVGLERARRGVSWTRDRDTACWFATRYWNADRKGKPLVLKRRVWREDVRYYSNDRQENEVLGFRPGNVKVDGTPDEWFARGAAKEAENHADRMRWLTSEAAA